MSYIGQGLPADTFQGYVTDTFTGNGSATTFTLSKEPFSEDSLIVVVDNVIQQPTTNFTVSGTTLTIVGTAILSGIKGYAIHTGGPLPIGGASELDLNGASDKLILDADGDTTISADTDDQIDFKTGGSDRMHIESGGNIGIGTSSSEAKLHILKNDSGALLDGNADNLFIEDNTTGMTIGSANDGEGHIRFSDSDDADVGAIGYFHSSNYMNIRVNAGERMRIDSDGLVGIGTTSPSPFKLHVDSNSSNNGIAKFNHSHATPEGIRIIYSAAAPDDTSTNFLEIQDSSALRLQILGDGDVKNHDGVYTSISSDERLKSNIVDANSQWDDIKAIKFRNFKKKDDIEKYGDNAWTLLGVIAQEAESVTPKLVQNRNPYAEEVKLNSVFGTLYTADDSETQDAVLYTSDDQEVIDGNKNVGDIKIPSTKQIGDLKEVKEQVKTFKDSILFWKCAKALQEAMTKIETLETKVKALEDV